MNNENENKKTANKRKNIMGFFILKNEESYTKHSFSNYIKKFFGKKITG